MDTILNMIMPYIYGVCNLPWWGNIIVLLVMTHITVMCVTLYLHRAQAHRGLDIHPILSHFCRLWLWLTTGMVTKEWVAIHRKHHAACETEEDPHSPQILGLKKVFFEGAELYRGAAKDREMIERFGHGCPDDWIERKVYTPHSAMGIFIMMGIDLVLFGIPGISIWALQMIWIPLFAAGVINGIGHYWGYRNFECPDAARNISPIGILMGGEELHNNHHTYGTSAKFSVKWWEFDLGWTYINAFRALGLIKVRKMAPKELKNSHKGRIDVDTLKDLLNNRFQVMASYTNEVIKPVWEAEKSKYSESAKAMLAKGKNIMSRHPRLVDEATKKDLPNMLGESKNMTLVHQYQERLQDIWLRTTASQKELIEAFQDWCVQAEKSGIKALQDFAQHIRNYALAR